VQGELGLYVCGGRGRHSRRTPDELVQVGDATGLDGAALARHSRLCAKVDGALVQDGFQLYLHGFIVAADGRWTVVQQGLRDASGTARRYHWLSEGLTSFVDDPHSAIEGQNEGRIVNLADRRASRSRQAQLELVAQGPSAALRVLAPAPERSADPAATPQPGLPHLALPARHEVHASDVVERRLRATLLAVHERGPRDFTELLLCPGVGARTVLSLALAAEMLHGAPCRFTDPARFALAHGGKDGHPFPVPRAVYDRTLSVLRSAVQAARLGNDEELAALRRVDHQARLAEAASTGAPLDIAAWLTNERRDSHKYGGRTVKGPVRPPKSGQLEMF
jgi:hypothetical protein